MLITLCSHAHSQTLEYTVSLIIMFIVHSSDFCLTAYTTTKKNSSLGRIFGPWQMMCQSTIIWLMCGLHTLTNEVFIACQAQQPDFSSQQLLMYYSPYVMHCFIHMITSLRPSSDCYRFWRFPTYATVDALLPQKGPKARPILLS